MTFLVSSRLVRPRLSFARLSSPFTRMPEHAVAGAMPVRGNALSRGIGRFALRIAGWRIVGELPSLDRFVLIVAPHTSNWDFLVGIGTMFALGLRASWLGKHSIFRGPFAPVLRWLGGVPVDRASSRGVVEQVAKEFERHERFVLGVAPEGTRRPVPQWRTGFHAIARAAGVMIVPVWFDYARREVGIGAPLATTEDIDADVRALRAHYTASMGKVPANYTG